MKIIFKIEEEMALETMQKDKMVFKEEIINFKIIDLIIKITEMDIIITTATITNLARNVH